MAPPGVGCSVVSGARDLEPEPVAGAAEAPSGVALGATGASADGVTAGISAHQSLALG
jgi:hypothetical protein